MNIYIVHYRKYDGGSQLDTTTVVARTLENAAKRVRPYLRKQTGYDVVLESVAFQSRVGCVDR